MNLQQQAQEVLAAFATPTKTSANAGLIRDFAYDAATVLPELVAALKACRNVMEESTPSWPMAHKVALEMVAAALAKLEQ